MDRKELVAVVGEELVVKLERENCEPTNRYRCDCDTTVEYVSHLDVRGGHISAWYYPEESDLDAVENLEDVSWEIDHYSSNIDDDDDEYEEYEPMMMNI